MHEDQDLCDDWDCHSDLGLGLGLQPGALENRNDFTYAASVKEKKYKHYCGKWPTHPSSHSDSEADSQHISDVIRFKKLQQSYLLRRASNKFSKNLICAAKQPVGSNQNTTTFTNAPIISASPSESENDCSYVCDMSKTDSLEQIVNDCEKSVKSFRLEKHFLPSTIRPSNGKKDINEQLTTAKQETESLQQELELCCAQLDAKHRAVQILQQQVIHMGKEHSSEIEQLRTDNSALQKRVNQLQFEIEYGQSQLNTSQETWGGRFDGVCKDNLSLQSMIDEKSIAIKKLNAEKKALLREKQELLALVDVEERERFLNLPASVPPASNLHEMFTTSEVDTLSILGACQCRQLQPEPCCCAYAAAKLRKELQTCQQELEVEHRNVDEAILTMNAYRMAFEEQLAHNRSLLNRLTQLTDIPPFSKAEKARAAIKWLIQQLNEDTCAMGQQEGLVQGTDSHTQTEDEEGRSDIQQLFATVPESDVPTSRVLKRILEKEPVEDAVDLLVDLVLDNSEALAHQRLISRILANRNKQLQQQLDVSTGKKQSTSWTSAAQ